MNEIFNMYFIYCGVFFIIVVGVVFISFDGFLCLRVYDRGYVFNVRVDLLVGK